jgi:hypothetical protein
MIDTWTTFLPPLNEINTILKLELNKNIFKSLIEKVKISSNDQFEDLNNIRSKIIYFSLNIKKLIDNLIKKDIDDEYALLLTINKEPFLENACCNKNYFLENDITIQENINSIKSIEKMLNLFKNIETASILFNNLNTKRKLSSISTNYDEQTMYEYFINKCKLNQNKSSPLRFKKFCKDIPDTYNKLDTITNQIKYLKDNNIIYTEQEFNDFLNFNNNNNITDIKVKQIIYSNIQKQKDLLKHLDEYDVDIIPKIFRKHMTILLDNFKINNLTEDTPPMRVMKNYLSSSNENMTTDILDFIVKHLSKKI